MMEGAGWMSWAGCEWSTLLPSLQQAGGLVPC